MQRKRLNWRIGIVLMALSILGGTSATLPLARANDAEGMAADPMTEQEYDAARAERIKWWQDARFGIFLCWTPASQIKLGDDGWNIHWGRITWDEYEKMARKFNPVDFDAETIAKQLKASGAKYVNFTIKHHAGFSMYDSDLTDWDMGGTVYGKDILKPLCEAVRNEGLHMGLYFSAWDWSRPEFNGVPREQMKNRGGLTEEMGNPQWPAFIDFYLGQVNELMSDYGQIDVLWIDAWRKDLHEQWATERFHDLVRSKQPQILLNDRWGDTQRADFITPENHIPTVDPGRPWETCMRACGGWFYTGPGCGDPKKLLRKLITCVSRNGNLLLSFPLDATGKFSPEAVEGMKQMGDWLKKNGEAVYGCGSAGMRSTYMWGSATAKPGHVYIHVFPEHYRRVSGGEPIVLPDFANKITAATLLADGRKVDFERRGADIWIPVKEDMLIDDVSTIIDLQIEGELQPAPDRFITEWAVLPLPANKNPEVATEWTTVKAEEDGLVNLSHLPNLEKYNEALLAVDIVSNSDRQAELMFGWSDVGGAYLNGKRVFQMRGYERKPVADSSRVAVNLKKGHNRLVFRLAKGSVEGEGERGAWGIYAWISGGKTLTIRPSTPQPFIDRRANWDKAAAVVEAETGRLSGGAEISAEPLYRSKAVASGTYVVLNASEEGDKGAVELKFTIPEKLADPHVILRYMGTHNGSMSVSVDGGKPINVPTAASGGWHPYWAVAPVKLEELSPGEHTLKVQGVKGGKIQLDLILVADGESMETGVLLRKDSEQ